MLERAGKNTRIMPILWFYKTVVEKLIADKRHSGVIIQASWPIPFKPYIAIEATIDSLNKEATPAHGLNNVCYGHYYECFYISLSVIKVPGKRYHTDLAIFKQKTVVEKRTAEQHDSGET